MRKLTVLTSLALALLLAGCASMSPEQSLAISCRSYAATLSSLAELRADGALSPSQVDTVNDLREIANPICDAQSTAPSGAADTVADVLRQMSDIKTESGQ